MYLGDSDWEETGGEKKKKKKRGMGGCFVLFFIEGIEKGKRQGGRGGGIVSRG